MASVTTDPIRKVVFGMTVYSTFHLFMNNLSAQVFDFAANNSLCSNTKLRALSHPPAYDHIFVEIVSIIPRGTYLN
jgi:hypothetical protein